MKPFLLAATALLAGAAISTAANAAWVVSYEGEAPGVQNTTATFSTSGVETFESLPTGIGAAPIVTTFGTSGAGSTIKGVYSSQGKGVQINAADQFGGAGGKGKYIVAFPNTPYSLSLSSDIKGGVNYFGFWLSALDKGNQVTFSGANGKTLFTFNPKDVINTIDTRADSRAYYGNPTNPWGQDKSEPFVFINFFDTTGSFSKVSFSEVGFGGGYESDNHTVGHYETMGKGTTVALTLSGPGAAVPQPATWALMILGVGGVGAALRRRRATLALAA